MSVIITDCRFDRQRLTLSFYRSLFGCSREGETEVMGHVAINGILRQCTLAPCVSPSHAMDVQIDVHADKIATRHFIGVKRSKILVAIVPDAYTERLFAVNADGCRGRRQAEPTYVATIGVVLWMDVFCLEVAERHLIAPEHGTMLAVGVILPRTATVEVNLREL